MSFPSTTTDFTAMSATRGRSPERRSFTLERWAPSRREKRKYAWLGRVEHAALKIGEWSEWLIKSMGDLQDPKMEVR